MLCCRNPKSTMRLYLAGNNKLVVDSDNILRLDDLDVVIIYKTLINNTFVVSLDLRYNHITDDGAKYLGLLLAVCTVSISAACQTLQKICCSTHNLKLFGRYLVKLMVLATKFAIMLTF